MDRAAYEQMARDESSHWWFAARRQIIGRLIEQQAQLPPDAQILEAGCGTGGNLDLLSRYGHVSAFEFNAEARQMASEKSGLPVAFGALPGEIPFDGISFDLIVLLDVLEHIDDDRNSIAALVDRLKPTGKLLVTVPAMPWLWSRHDEIHHHKRRYTRSSLRAVIAASGLAVECINYFNTLLFPLAVAQRVTTKLGARETGTAGQPGALLHTLFQRTFSAERHFVGNIPMPFGLSLFALAGRTLR